MCKITKYLLILFARSKIDAYNNYENVGRDKNEDGF